ncbi:hypothetical protein BUALT_Bualt07G0101100 [Buddleja alternifolia]|uniref:Uncharacterized protein n=1 Tax=Buddleja alternifolia TaxID=168488 RepID=A0AAV6XAW7_9LAMI|nr:hypothetical protein BUALT_Bualt07G0101100 [Buddleja alternifolia]
MSRATRTWSKQKMTVVRTKRRTLVSGANRGRGPRTHSLFRIREIEQHSMSQQPERMRRNLHGTWRTANALRSTPRRDPEGRSTRWKWDVLTNRVPPLWVFSTRKMDAG